MVPGPELLGGAAEGGWAEWTRQCPPASQPPEVHLSTIPGLSPRLPASGQSSPCPSPCPLSSGFFLCNLFFKKSLYYFFIRLQQQQLLGAWGFIFWAGGGGGAILSLCLS